MVTRLSACLHCRELMMTFEHRGHSVYPSLHVGVALGHHLRGLKQLGHVVVRRRVGQRVVAIEHREGARLTLKDVARRRRLREMVGLVVDRTDYTDVSVGALVRRQARTKRLELGVLDVEQHDR